MQTKPNILIVMADQMTASLTGAYGHPVVKTPNLNRLAERGVRFDAAYTNCPICAPARAAMLSGRYVSRTRTYDNGAILPCDVPTFAHHLRHAGYETVVSGKMHMVGADQLHGFERRLTTDIYPSSFKWTPDWKSYGKSGINNDKAHLIDHDRIGVANWTWQMDYDTETRFRALEFLRSRRLNRKKEPSRPFCLLVSFTHPHPPYQITPEFWDLYEDADIDLPEIPDFGPNGESQMDQWLHEYQGIPREVLDNRNRMYTLRRAYYAAVSYVDAQLGTLFQTLEECGLADNTAVIFTSDHGELLGERCMIEKRSFYESSSRVPLIASFPTQWAANEKCVVPISLIDLFPTLVEFTRAPEPIDVDGQSFLPYLSTPGAEDTGRLAISEYHCEGVSAPCFMARRGSLKYIYIHGHDPRLFDLAQDPGETVNLAGRAEYKNEEDALRQEILARFDPDAIAADVQRSQSERMLMQQAMQQGAPVTWGYQPFFDAAKQYCR